MRILRHPLLLLLIPVVAYAAQYPYFAPGGALSCTGNCTTQSVNVGSGAFITGLLPNANLANSSITLNGNVIALGASDVLALASADFVNQGTTTTVLHGNAAGNPSFALVNLGTEVTSLLPFANLDPAMVPTWTGATWTWSNAQPRLLWNETDQGADLKLWDCSVQAGVFTCRTRTDADGAGVNFMAATRGTTTAITDVAFGNTTNNPTFSFLGTGVASFGGRVTAAGVNVTGAASVPAGMVLGTNGLTFYSGGTLRADFLGGGNFQPRAGIQSGGTKPTVTGCSNTTTLGGAVSGSYVSGTTGTCTVTITLPAGPTNGYFCTAHDDTTAVDYTQSAIVTTVTTLTISGTTVSGDKIVWGCAFGY